MGFGLRVVVFQALLATLIALSSPAAALSILLLNSYHKGNPWTDTQSDSIEATLKGELPGANIDVVYMDTKRFTAPSHVEDMKRTLANRYAATHVDAIVVTDEPALLFALHNKAAILNDAPVIYSGIFAEFAEAETAGRRDVTGVYERADPAGTIGLASRLQPGLKRIYLIHDGSDTGLAFERQARTAIAASHPDIGVISMGDLRFGELLDRLGTLPEDSAVLHLTYARDASGLIRPSERFVQDFAAAADVPFYALYKHYLFTGAVGGYVVDGTLQGEQAARLALRVLRGATPGELAPIDEPPPHPIVNYEAARRWNLDLRRGGADLEVVGKPFSFVETYFTLVLTVVAVIAILLILIALLLIGIARRRRVQRKLVAGIADLERSRRELQHSEERYRLVARTSRDILWEWDLDTGERRHSGRVEEVLGFRANHFRDLELWLAQVHPDDRDLVRSGLREHLGGRTAEYKQEYRVRKADGSWVWLQANGQVLRDETGAPRQMVGSYTDITADKEHETRIDFLAYHDPLTGLGNRLHMSQVVDSLIAASKGTAPLALAFIDLDNFKYINDSSGHKAGDRLLVDIGVRLRMLVEDACRVARLGGDEFAILLDASDDAFLSALETRLRDLMRAPFTIGGNRFYVGCSVGISVYPRDGATFDELLQSADTAMYDAKSTGRGGVTFYTPDMRRRAVERLRLHNRLRDAQERDDFRLAFQPQVNARDGRLIGAEALLRWQDAELGRVPPDKFIPSCEESGLIIPLGGWVLRQACRALRQLRGAVPADFVMSVNVSVVQLMHGHFEEEVLGILREEGVEPESIALEITESQLMGVFEEGAGRLRRLMNAGLSIALDDFGTGYSSLTYLRHLPLHTLKLDKDFIGGLPQEEKLISSIIRIAHDVGLAVVAEGVEQASQRDRLTSAECDRLQGYLIGRPMPADDFDSFARTWEGFAVEAVH